MKFEFLVIDGSSMLTTCYYGNLPRAILFEKDEAKKEALYEQILHTPDGVYTNAVYAMSRILLNLLEKCQPQHLVIVFDRTRNTFRRDIYADYKGTRGVTPSPLKEQFQTMEEFLTSCGILTLSSDIFEADDLAGSILSRFASEEHFCTFLTKDHDYLQLVTPYVQAWMVQGSEAKAEELFAKYSDWLGITYADALNMGMPAKTVPFFKEIILEEEGVLPENIVDKKALFGDTSDNIPGVKGIGEVTAAKLVQEYGSLEGIYSCLDACTNEKEEKEWAQFLKDNVGIKQSPVKKLKEGRENAFLSKELATIRTDAPVPEELTAYECHVDKEAMKNAFERFAFSSLLSHNYLKD